MYGLSWWERRKASIGVWDRSRHDRGKIRGRAIELEPRASGFACDYPCGFELRWEAGQSWFVVDLSESAGDPAVDLLASWVVASIARTGSCQLPDPVGLGRAFDPAWAVLGSAGQIHAGTAERWFDGDCRCWSDVSTGRGSKKSEVASLAVSFDSTGSQSTSALAAFVMVAVVAVGIGSGTASVEGPAVAAARTDSMDQEYHVLGQVYVVAQFLGRTGSDRLGWEVNDPSIYLLLPMPNHQLGRHVSIDTHLFSTLNSSLLFRFTHFQCRVVLVQSLH